MPRTPRDAAPQDAAPLRRAMGLGLVLTALGCSGTASWAESLTVPLECRLSQGPWQPCTMRVERIGERWWLEVGGERLQFRSDGSGRVILMEASGSRRAVQPLWTGEQQLCWDGVCTRGELPLD